MIKNRKKDPKSVRLEFVNTLKDSHHKDKLGIMQLLNILLFWVFFGLLCSYLAKRRGKNPFLWFFLGLFLGIFAVALIIVLPLIENKFLKKSPASPPPPQAIPSPLPLKETWNENWFYLDAARQTQGPLPFSELVALWHNNQLTAHSFLWKEGMENWKKISDMNDLYEDLKSGFKQS